MSRVLRSGLAVIALLLSLLVMPTLAGAAPGNGNSDAAHACQQGGYANYTRADGSTFANTGECVSYAAHGGQLKPKARLVVTYGPPSGGTQQTITGAGLLPGSVVTYTTSNTPPGTVPGSTVGADGTVSVTNNYACGFPGFVATATTADGGTITTAAEPPC